MNKSISLKSIITILIVSLVLTSVSFINPITADAATKKPARVKKPTVSNIKTTTVKVKWKKAKRGKKYQVYYKLKTAKKWSKKTTKKKTITLKKLKAGKKYQIKIRATNKKKKGKFSKVRTFTTKKKSTTPNPGKDPDDNYFEEGGTKGQDDYYYTSNPYLNIEDGYTRNGSKEKGAFSSYANVIPVFGYNASGGTVPTEEIIVKNSSATLVYTLDNTTPTLTNGTKVTSSSGTVTVKHDKLTHTLKCQVYIGSTPKGTFEFILTRLLYWDSIPANMQHIYSGLGKDGIDGTADDGELYGWY